MTALGQYIGLKKIFKLRLSNLLLVPTGQNTACTNIIAIVDILGRVLRQLVPSVHLLYGLCRLLAESNVIIVSRDNDLEFTLRIEQSTLLMGRKLIGLCLKALHTSERTLMIVIKFFIERLALT